MWPNPKETADLVTFTKKFLNGKVHFLCSDKIRLDQCYLNSANLEIRSMLMLALC